MSCHEAPHRVQRMQCQPFYRPVVTTVFAAAFALRAVVLQLRTARAIAGPVQRVRTWCCQAGDSCKVLIQLLQQQQHHLSADFELLLLKSNSTC